MGRELSSFSELLLPCGILISFERLIQEWISCRISGQHKLISFCCMITLQRAVICVSTSPEEWDITTSIQLGILDGHNFCLNSNIQRSDNQTIIRNLLKLRNNKLWLQNYAVIWALSLESLDLTGEFHSWSLFLKIILLPSSNHNMKRRQ